MRQDPFWSAAPCPDAKSFAIPIPSLACAPLGCLKLIHLTEMARQ